LVVSEQPIGTSPPPNRAGYYFAGLVDFSIWWYSGIKRYYY